MTDNKVLVSSNHLTRGLCALIVSVGIALHYIATYYAFHTKTTLASFVNYSHIIYIILVPIVLLFLRGERRWRLTVFGIWVGYVGLILYTIITMG
jgi:drug/metabolite transporter (DMT)-like permease